MSQSVREARAGWAPVLALVLMAGCQDNGAGTIAADPAALKDLHGFDAPPPSKASKSTKKGRDDRLRSPKELIGELKK